MIASLVSRLAQFIRIAQFIIFCSASNLAEPRCLSSPVQGSSPAQTWTSSRPSRAHGHHLRPSTNCYKLSDPSNINCLEFYHSIRRIWSFLLQGTASTFVFEPAASLSALVLHHLWLAFMAGNHRGFITLDCV